MCEKRRKWIFWILTLCLLELCAAWNGRVRAEAFSDSLYATGAVLMDGDSGRVLYGKDADKQMPMASTTKIMTCILAIENASPEDEVEVSAKAAAQPDVQLNIREGERYRLKDLLYSLMLKSHNDVAVAIAEHVGGSVEGFAAMMNEKAAELGCRDTHFVTPNGLDAEDAGGAHSTTARDLATIMRYCIRNKQFLAITQTPDYSFSDLDGRRIFAVHNANALLGSMEGLLSGKTGFTGRAGYCYVCAVKRDERTFVIALLACGWPNNKTYKWQDTRKLVDYAFQNYGYRSIKSVRSFGALPVKDGIPVNDRLYEPAYTNVEVLGLEERKLRFLVREDEEIRVETKIKKELSAPVREGTAVGTVTYSLGEETLCSYPIVLKNTIEKRSFPWCLGKLVELYLVKCKRNS